MRDAIDLLMLTPEEAHGLVVRFASQIKEDMDLADLPETIFLPRNAEDVRSATNGLSSTGVSVVVLDKVRRWLTTVIQQDWSEEYSAERAIEDWDRLEKIHAFLKEL